MNRCLIIIIVLFVACSEKKQTVSKKTTYRSNWIHPLYFQEDIRTNLSFPYWFNESTLREKKVKSIIITAFEIEENDTKTPVRNQKSILEYSFHKNGKPNQLLESEFREGLLIAYQQFNFAYKSESEKGSYTWVEKRFSNIKSNYHIFDYETSSKRFQTLKSQQEKIHIVPNKAHWKSININKMIHPSPEDWIVWGRIVKPIRKYKVRNLVKEKEVSEYTYVSKNFPKNIVSSSFPFEYRRWFQYKDGNFIGFVDSTFIDKTFVTSSRTNLICNRVGIPVKIVQVRLHAQSTKSNKKEDIITIKYYQ
jgi:hypothetical protein